MDEGLVDDSDDAAGEEETSAGLELELEAPPALKEAHRCSKALMLSPDTPRQLAHGLREDDTCSQIRLLYTLRASHEVNRGTHLTDGAETRRAPRIGGATLVLGEHVLEILALCGAF